MKKYLLRIAILFFFFVLAKGNVYAQGTLSTEEILEAKVKKILEEKQVKPMGSTDFKLSQKLELTVTKGSLKGQAITVESGDLSVASNLIYRINDRVLVSFNKDAEGNTFFQITDYIRRESLFLLLLIFVVLAIIVAKWRGILSLIGMGISFLVIFFFVLPMILSGHSPMGIAILGSIIIIPVSFFLSHGFNKKTMTAIAGTLIALIITGVLASVFIEVSKLTGFASEEAGFLQVVKQGAVNIKGLLLAGIIIGILGVLDDVTISQSAIVFQLKQTNEKLKFNDLYRMAMNVGRDHIASMVNTLILVYAGAALPLLLLFIDNPHPFSEIVNYEIVADEIVKTLVGSIGLILAVPITTMIASFVAGKTKNKRWL